MKDNFENGNLFVEEFRKLFMSSPQCGSWTRASENCDYGDITTVSKDCYMCFNSGNCRNAYYCEDSRGLNDSGDCAFCESCELCYECTDCETCYNCNYCQDCTNCENVNFSYDLRRCKDCFGCCTLRDKQYCIFNQQYSAEKYAEKIKMFDYTNQAGIKFIEQKVKEFQKENPRMYVHQHDTENCTGDYIYHSKNCHQCFDTRHTEDSGYIYQANLDMGTRDSWDCGPIPTGMDLCYDVAYAHYLFECQHLYWCGNLKNSQWCCNCMESENLFGCHYLKNRQKKFYILNREVNEDEYKKQTKEINEQLKKLGIFTIYDLLYKPLPSSRKEIDDSILKRNCVLCEAEFALCEDEIKFYKKYDLAFPVYCPECRSKQRYKLRNERKMHKRTCDSCKNTLISTYPNDSKFIVYCLDCWHKHLC